MKRCPHCRQPITPVRKRVCFDCGKPMSNHHKWTLEERNGVLTPVHRHCDHPTSYVVERGE